MLDWVDKIQALQRHEENHAPKLEYPTMFTVLDGLYVS